MQYTYYLYFSIVYTVNQAIGPLIITNLITLRLIAIAL